MNPLLIKAVVGVAAIAGAATGATSMTGHGTVKASTEASSESSIVQTYTVRSGDTLYNIAERFCGRGDDYPALAAASGISNPSLIYAGQTIKLACGGSSSAQGSSSSSSGQAATVTTGSVAANGQANIPGTVPSVFSYYGLEQLWVGAGGASGDRGVAACIAEAESGGQVWATGSHGERGLWQIAPGWGSLSTYDPSGNARAAVIISHDGSNWGPWTTAGRCGV